jgi:uncharacterized protein YgbK (DUF1537 family)
VLDLARVDELFVEGGATASVVVRGSGWTELRVAAELAPGLVRLSVPAGNPRHVTLKPGSYPWPEEVLRGPAW